MEQKDYILREIEKIGVIVRAVLGHITGEEHKEAITVGNEFEQTTEWILERTNISLNKILKLEKQSLKDYISTFKGINITNLELLAEVYYQTGIRSPEGKKEKLLKKALQIYELCCETDRTYSFGRERKMSEIRNMI